MQLQISESAKYYLTRVVYSLLVLLILPLLVSCESNRTIVNGIDEREANEIIVLLSSKGINAEKVKSTEGTSAGGTQKAALWDISVPDQETTEAMSILNNAGLPKKKALSLLNIFSNTGLVPTDMAEKIRYQAGLASQIASTIRSIDGVLDADVILSFPQEDPLNPNAPKKPITASVYIKHNGILDDPNSHLVSKIKNLVAASVSGLKPENVTLIATRARFSETPIGLNPKNEEEKQYANVWSITIAKDSITRFRIIFFSFSLLILLLILAFVWIAWKTFPLLKPYGGLKSLFHLKSIAAEGEKNPEVKESSSKKESKAAEGEENDESMADEGMDFDGEIDVSDENKR